MAQTNPFAGRRRDGTRRTLPPRMHHVPDGTGVEVLAWVGEDLERAAVALAREEQREKPRRTLMRSLSDLQQQE